jgi:hypothetical protein
MPVGTLNVIVAAAITTDPGTAATDGLELTNGTVTGPRGGVPFNVTVTAVVDPPATREGLATTVATERFMSWNHTPTGASP